MRILNSTMHCFFHSNPIMKMFLTEVKIESKIVVPLTAMNLAWFAKSAITTAFLGHLGELSLAGGALGLSLANFTGFSFLNGLCGAMEPICGQAHGANNIRLLHKTLVMTTLLLLLVTLPTSFLWLHVDKILVHFGQEEEISTVAKTYLYYLIPDLFVTSLLCPLKAYLSAQCMTLPTMFSSAVALAFHIPVNILLSRAMGLKGVSMAVWVTDMIAVVLLVTYVVIIESKNGRGRWKEGGWLEQNIMDWVRLVKLCGSCCVNTCLEWWCYEILILLTGHLPNAKEALGVVVIVLNFDYLLYSVMLALATCVSTRVSNELGANRGGHACRSAHVCMGVGTISGCIGSLVMVGLSGVWGRFFSHHRGIIKGVKRAMLLMPLVELFNFPLTVCGGIVRGTARPLLAMYANLAGFYFLALPLSVIFAFRLRLGLLGLFIGFFVGVVTCFILLLAFIARIDWVEEANKAQTLVSTPQAQQVTTNDVNHPIEYRENQQV